MCPLHRGGGTLQNLIGGLEVNTWGEDRGLKTVLKNTCEGVHLLVKLLALGLQACKFTKNYLLRTYSSRILPRF